jgi:hypothetical protein
MDIFPLGGVSMSVDSGKISTFKYFDFKLWLNILTTKKVILQLQNIQI